MFSSRSSTSNKAFDASISHERVYQHRSFTWRDLPGAHRINDGCQRINGNEWIIHRGQVEVNRALFGKDAIQQKFQHLSIAGLPQFDGFAHERFFFALKQGFGH
jgi:hypothetical protein